MPQFDTISVLVLLCVLCAVPGQSGDSRTPDQYAVLIDAGSTSSKGKVYGLYDDGETIPSLQVLSKTKVKPGLGSYQDDHSGIAGHIDEMLQVAQEAIPEDMHGLTPIYVMATAGESMDLCQVKSSNDYVAFNLN